MEKKCIFCKIVRKEMPADIVFEDDEVMAFRDINPVADTHLMVIPKKHIETINDLKKGDSRIISKIFFTIKDLAFDHGISADGYRVVANCNKAAGQEVFHVHFHLLGGRKFNWPPG